MFPGARFLHVLRSGHRTVNSMINYPTKAAPWATTRATVTVTEGVSRPRKASCRLTTTSAARSGIATENAMMETLAETSSDGAVRNGCTELRDSLRKVAEVVSAAAG